MSQSSRRENGLPRRVSVTVLLALFAVPATSAQQPASPYVQIVGLRSDRGLLQYCVAARGKAFPNCGSSGAAMGAVSISGGTARIVLPALPSGDYAIAVFHDANRNKRLDTFAGIPREGYGFSRNPAFRPRAPRFEEAAINLPQSTNTEITIRYLF